MLAAGIFFIVSAWPSRFYFLNDDMLHLAKVAQTQFGHNNATRYVAEASLYLDYQLYHHWAPGYHISNLMLHVLSSVCLPFSMAPLLKSFEINTGRNFQILVILLFLLYPFHGEGLFWIIGRGASMGQLGLLLCCWLVGQLNFKLISHCLILAITYMAALFTYESVWPLPLLLGTWFIFLPTNSEYKARVRIALVVVIITFLAHLVPRYWAIHEIIGPYEAQRFFQMDWKGLFTNYGKLVARSYFAPLYLGHFYSALSGLFLVISVFWIILAAGQKNLSRITGLLMIWWLVSLLPYLSLGISVRGYESDRFLYTPSAWQVFLLAFALVNVKTVVPYLKAGTVVFVLCFFSICFWQEANSFEKAGKLSKQTLRAICEVPLEQAIQVRNLPGSFNGIPVLRYGFTEAVGWFCPGENVISRIRVVQVQSFWHHPPAMIVKKDGATTSLVFGKQEP